MFDLRCEGEERYGIDINLVSKVSDGVDVRTVGCMKFVKGLNAFVETRIARRRRLDANAIEHGQLDRNDPRFGNTHFHKV